MKLSVQELRSLANLLECAERMVELYWDTDKGQMLRGPWRVLELHSPV